MVEKKEPDTKFLRQSNQLFLTAKTNLQRADSQSWIRSDDVGELGALIVDGHQKDLQMCNIV